MPIASILMVDDEADIRRIGQIALEVVGGWRVLLAGDGIEALDIAARERPDVVLLDVMMPGLDGVATLAQLRQLPHLATTPVVFMTAKVQKQEVERYLALGAAGVIGKPFDPMELARIIRTLASP